MATKMLKERIDVDESVRTAERGATHQTSPLVDHLVPRSPDKHLDYEESELAEAGLIRLPAQSLSRSFWKMPAPRVSFADAVSSVTSERDEG